MANYSIKDLEALTGIKAHTIRIWEKRHNIISPERSSTNIRSYSDDDLKRILNISILYNQGYKISKIAALSGDQLVNKVTELSNDEKPENEVFIDQLTISMVELDELKFEKLLSSCILKYGFEDTMLKVVYPFLRKIGVLWLSNNINPAQEHFMSNLVRQKIIVAIDGLDNHVRDNAKTVVLFLPEHELHELGLLFFHYLIKKKGYKTYYLGQNVPFIDLKKVCDLVQPDILISNVSYVSNDKQLLEYLRLLNDTFKSQDIYLTGKPITDRVDQIPKSFFIFDSPNTLIDLF
jgi:MerR family transcriptional regulator, light-induced transcriptional regulator